VNDQVFYKREQPAKPAGAASLRVGNLPAGTYSLQVYQTGYRVNDAYTTYLDLGAPDQYLPAREKSLPRRCGRAQVGPPVQQG